MITKKDIESFWDEGLFADDPKLRESANKIMATNLNKMKKMGINIDPIVKILNTPKK